MLDVALHKSPGGGVWPGGMASNITTAVTGSSASAQAGRRARASSETTSARSGVHDDGNGPRQRIRNPNVRPARAGARG